MAFTPICPKCGSSAVERFTDHGLSCTRCGFDGRSGQFTRLEDRLDKTDWSERTARRRGLPLGSRTIPLSDETGDGP